jgi:hypothetical protein
MSESAAVERLWWAVEWHSVNAVDGDRRHLQWDNTFEHTFPHLFRTRRECAAYIKRHHGYLKDRPDLRREPFGWRMPRPVRVLMRIEPLQ